ncbi:MAG TPA: amidohydrolase [Synergistaceae bacterium]|nr:amidohydrolase [Synergistaceae bacterium]
MMERLRGAAAEIAAEMTAWRREFHAHPELSFEEVGTTRRVAELLRSFGYDNLKVGLGGVPTGVVADLGVGRAGWGVALRADLDALPMEETADRPYRSQKPGVMHSCGHDAHTAMLLGAAKILKCLEPEIPGRVRFIFQPSEESPHRSGARAMIAEGALEGMDAIAGIHVWSGLPSGVLGYRPGAAMASSDEWECVITGRGGHGAMPHEAVDPVVAASALVGMLQTVVSRRISPLETAVVTVGKIEAGTTYNIIPEKAFLQGTVRTFNPEVRRRVPEIMGRIVQGVAGASECTAEFNYRETLPPTVNDPIFTDLARRVGEDLLGGDGVRLVEPTMGAEDMSLYLERLPGAFLFLGVGNEAKGTTFPQHHPAYDIDEAVLPLGCAFLSSLAWRFLAGT